LIRDLARQQVSLQNAIVQPLGRTADGLMKFNVQVPKGLDAVANKTAIAKKELQIYNKVIQDGGVQLINWGKNTQWAGRQLTVGLTVPLAAFGMAAAKAFREADQELVRLTKVYGGIAATSAVDLSKVRSDVTKTARELASAYGSSFKDTISLAADIAATGKQGNDLLLSVKETTRLAVLGEVDRQDAMKATLAIQNAFKQSTTELSESINFLNAVENQTSTSLGDLIEAIPKAGPVVQSLGGNVQDLALYLTAMKEGGINASEGANALKSALASMINPTKVAREMFSGLGIDLGGIVTQNAGNLTATITALQSSLDKLNPLQKSQAIEQLFGKFQFARLSALFENLGKEGSQTLQVMDLMKASSADLANVAGRELSQITESASGKYQRALQTLKADLAGVGESFLNVQTFFLNLTSSVVKFIEMLPGPVKSMLTLVAGITALAGPIIMLTGVFANFIGYVIKGIGHLKALFRGGEGFKLLTPEILAASKAGSLVEKTFYSDAAAADILSASLKNLITEFTILQQKAASGAISVQPTIATIAGTVAMAGTPGGIYKGVTVDANHPLVGRMGTRASAHMNPVGNMSEAERAAQTIFGMVPGPIPVNRKIGRNPQMYADHGLPAIPGLTTIGGVSTGVIPEEAAKWHAMTGAIAMQSEAEIALLKKEVAATGTVTHELSGSYQALLPEITRLTKLAAQEGAAIVAQTQAGAITVEQARAKIVALNARVEAMIAETTTQIAITQGRTANLTMVPFTNQPVVDPKTGKSNMKEMFHKTPTATLVDNVARALGGIRTSGGGFSTETTIRRNQGGPIYRNQGGPIYYNDGSRSVVPGPNVNADVVPAMLTPGEFVVNKKATQANLGLLQSINSGKLGGSVSSSQGGYGPRPSATDISRMFNGLFSKAKSRSTVKVRGHSLPRHFWSTATGQDANSRRIDLIESHTAGWPIKNKQGREYTQRELELLSKAEVNEIWKGVDRSHFAPGLKVGSDGQYISPGLFGPQTRGGAGGNLSMNQGGSPQDILASLLGTPIHPFATMRSASRLLGYPSKDINSAFDLAWKELTATLKTRTTPFGKDQDTFEEFAGSILKRHLKNLKVPDTSINFYDEMHRLGTARGSGIKGSGASVVANDPDITFNIPQRRMGGPVSGASPYIVGEDGPELFVPQSSGKIIPGFNKGGQIQHLAGGGQVMAMLMRMIPGLAGYQLGSQLTGGSMMGGMAGSIGGDLIGTALASRILNIGKSADQVTKRVSLLQKGLELLKNKPVLGWTTAILAGAAVIKSINDKINEHRRIINLAFGQNSETASKLGLSYKSLNEQLKEFKDKTDLAAAAAASFYASSTSANGLHITIQQLKELKESVQKDLPDLIEVFNKAGGDEVVQKASQLKAQFIAGGMSAEKATNTIYALIESSNKAYMSLGVLADGGFGLIKDNASAAVFSIETFNRLLNEGNTDQLATSLETALNAVQALEKSMVGTEDANGNIITQSDAWLDVLDKVNKAQGSNAILTNAQYNAIKKAVPQFAEILDGSEKTAAVLAKWKLYLSDANIELKYMSDDMAIALATAQVNLTSVLSSGQSGTDLDKLFLAIRKAENANKTNSSVIQKNAEKSRDAINAEIKLHQKNIDKIKEEADARRKSLSRQSEDEDIITQIKKKQLEYQDALAMGDSATAAQAQLDLQMLQRSQERTLAIRAIDDKEKADTAVQQAKIDKLQEKLEASSKTLQKQLDGVKAATTKVEALKTLFYELNSFIASAGNIDSPEELSKANEFQKQLNALGLSNIKVGSQPIKIPFAPTTGIDSILSKVMDGNKLNVADVNSFATAGLLKQILTATKQGGMVPPMPINPMDVTSLGGGASATKFVTASVLNKAGIPLIPNSKVYTGRIVTFGRQEYTVGPYNENLKQYPLILNKAMGGPIQHYEPGGNVRGPGTGTSDSIPAMLSNGEYVIKADSVKKYGTETFDALNAGKFADGGYASDIPHFRLGGLTTPIKNLLGSLVSKFTKPKAPSAPIVVPRFTTTAKTRTGSQLETSITDLFDSDILVKRNVGPSEMVDSSNLFHIPKNRDGDRFVSGGATLNHDVSANRQLYSIIDQMWGINKSGSSPSMLGSMLMESLNASGFTKRGPNLTLSQDRSVDAEAVVKRLNSMGLGDIIRNYPRTANSVDYGLGFADAKTSASVWAHSSSNYATDFLLNKDYREGFKSLNLDQLSAGSELLRNLIKTKSWDSKMAQDLLDKYNSGFANGGIVGYHKGGPVGHKHGPAEAARLEAARKKKYGITKEKPFGTGLKAFLNPRIWGFGKTHGAADLPYDAYKNIVFPTATWADRMVGDTIGGALNIKSPLMSSTNRKARAQMSGLDVGIEKAVDLLGILPYGRIVGKAATAGMSKATIAKIAEEKLASKAATAAYRASVKPVPLPYKALNTFNQYANYFKAKKLVKEKQYHGSSDRGNSYDRPLYGESVLDGTSAYDPHYGMSFFSTSSKAEADLYAGGYNVPGQWGESYGTMNQVTKIPFGKYIDYRKKNLKYQNYLLWKLLQGKDYRYAGENLGSLMDQAGTTGSIMKRISNGKTSDPEIDKATWLALNNSKGTVLQETDLGFSSSNLGFQSSGFTYNNWSSKSVQEFLRKNLGKTGLTQDRAIINDVLSKTPIRKVHKTVLEDLQALGATTYTSTGNHISLPAKTTFGTTIHEGAHALDAVTGTSVRKFIGEVARTKSKVDADRLSRLWISSQQFNNPYYHFINRVRDTGLHPNLLTGIQEATATDAHAFVYKNAGLNLFKKLRIGNPYTAGQGYIENFEQLIQYSHGVQSMQGKIDLANGLLTSERMPSSLRRKMQQWVRQLQNEKDAGMSYPGFDEFGKPGSIGRIESLRPNASSSSNVNSMFTPPELRTVEDYIGRPRTYADSMAHVLDRFNFGDQAGTFFRGLSMHDMAAIAGYTRVPNPNLIYGRDYMEKWGPTSWGGFADDTAEAPWAHLARSWKPEAASVFPRGTRSPLPSTEEAMPYLNMLPGLKIGEYWRPDTLKSITAELEFAKHIAVSGGTGGGETKAIAKIIVDPKVKGVGDFAKFSPPKPKPNWMGTEFTEGAIAPFTKYILQAINKNAHSLTDESKGVSHLIDEYVFKAVETSPYLEFLKRQMSIKTEGLLPIVKKATGGYVAKYRGPVLDDPSYERLDDVPLGADRNPGTKVPVDMNYWTPGFFTPKRYIPGLNLNGESGTWTPEPFSENGRIGKPAKLISKPIPKQFATGGYVNPSYSANMSVPQFKDGINMVPADMLAMIHKNEAIVPANMNPFNPNANNATMAPAVYNISMTNHAAEGMDVNVFADVTTRKVLAEIKRLDVQRASMNGMGRRV
jgi:TP901 family phage tail tape measure protein